MYAMFGFLCFKGLHNFVPACTGASRPVIGGKICPGDNFAAVELSAPPWVGGPSSPAAAATVLGAAVERKGGLR